jgi:hypothetical protein
MAKVIERERRSFNSVKENMGVLRRAYELHFRRGLTWAAVEREMSLKSAGGMTAMNCAERYIDVTDDPVVIAEGKEWRRKRKVALATRKKAMATAEPPVPAAQESAPPRKEDAITLGLIDARIENRLRDFAVNLAKIINMAVC